MKRIILAIGIAAAFLVGYAGASEAWPGVSTIAENHGYFKNEYDTQGDDVFAGGIPTSVNTATEFINFINSKLASSNGRDRIGASFIIQYTRGAPYDRNYLPNASQRADWESRVRHAAAAGLITWSANFTYSGNSYWQGNNGGGDNPNDDAFYYENGTRVSIIFRNTAGTAVAVIKRDCANPLTYGSMAGIPDSWTIAGSTVLSNATPAPGNTVSWTHSLENTGVTTATNIYQVSLDGPSSVPTGISVSSANSGDFDAGEERVVRTDNFTIPVNAAAGSKYCRRIGWDPVNSAGASDGRGAERCAVVTIPAKLKAAMSTNPSTMMPGESTSFTPAISAAGNSSPVTATCSIGRLQYAPGSATPTGPSASQPCVTTAGSTSIVIGSGATVTLRPNVFTSGDGMAIGTRICDTITITSPSGAGYFVNPADQTATSCVTFVKTPYVHFLGGDVWSGGGFAAVAPGTCSSPGKITTVTRSAPLAADGTRPGSGTAYAAFALGKITEFGSGGMALVAASGVGDAWTFSNINTSNLGFFGASQHCISDYAGTYSSAPALGAGTIDVAGAASGSWSITGNPTFQGTMTPGAKKVYYVTGDVTIGADIKYPATYGSVADIPSLVIIATGNIRVASGVAQMDGHFISRGTFYTCYPKSEPATVGVCSTALTVNGSVSATALDLFRTGGATGATPALQKAPAETFNLTPELYITNALNQTNQAVVTTSNVRELPPRF